MSSNDRLDHLKNVVAVHETFWSGVAQRHPRSKLMQQWLTQQWSPWFQWFWATVADVNLPALAQHPTFIKDTLRNLAEVRHRATSLQIPIPDIENVSDAAPQVSGHHGGGHGGHMHGGGGGHGGYGHRRNRRRGGGWNGYGGGYGYEWEPAVIVVEENRDAFENLEASGENREASDNNANREASGDNDAAEIVGRVTHDATRFARLAHIVAVHDAFWNSASAVELQTTADRERGYYPITRWLSQAWFPWLARWKLVTEADDPMGDDLMRTVGHDLGTLRDRAISTGVPVPDLSQISENPAVAHSSSSRPGVPQDPYPGVPSSQLVTMSPDVISVRAPSHHSAPSARDSIAASIDRETDQRFWIQTGYKPGERLNRADKTDLAMVPVWLAIRHAVANEVASHAPNGGSPASARASLAPQIPRYVPMLTHGRDGVAISGSWLTSLGHGIGSTMRKLKGPITLAAVAVATVYAGPIAGAAAAKLAPAITDFQADHLDPKKKAAAKKIIDKAKEDAKTDPVAAKALDAAEKAVAQTAVAYHVNEIAGQAAQGDPVAQQHVEQIKQAAQEGDPAAESAMDGISNALAAYGGAAITSWSDAKVKEVTEAKAKEAAEAKAKEEAVISGKALAQGAVVKLRLDGSILRASIAVDGQRYDGDLDLAKVIASLNDVIAASANGASGAPVASSGWDAIDAVMVGGGSCGARLYAGVDRHVVIAIIRNLLREGAVITGNNPWKVVTNNHGVELLGTWNEVLQALSLEITDSDFLVPCGAIWNEIEPMLLGVGARVTGASSTPFAQVNDVAHKAGLVMVGALLDQHVGVVCGASPADALAIWRKTAADAANRSHQIIVGFVKPRGNPMQLHAFDTLDDADDWFGGWATTPDAIEYVAYFDKSDATYPGPLNELLPTAAGAVSSGWFLPFLAGAAAGTGAGYFGPDAYRWVRGKLQTREA